MPTNIHRLEAFRTEVVRHWRQALTRRSQRHRMTWKRMLRLAERWVPRPTPFKVFFSLVKLLIKSHLR